MPWKVQVYGVPRTPTSAAEREAFEANARQAVRQSIDRGIPVHYGSEEDGLIIGYADEGRRWLCLHPYHAKGKATFWFDEGKGFAGGKWPWGIVIFTQRKAAAEMPSQRELTIAALKQAVEMWKTDKRGNYYCGLAAYEHWVGWLKDVEAGKLKDAKGGMQGNAWYYDVLVHSRRIAGRWLAEKAKTFDGPAAAKFASAAAHYSQIATICLESLDCPWSLALSPGAADKWTSDMRKDQIRRLELSRGHDQAAIADIEAALSAIAAGSK
jgi:hypothetical protein